MSSPVDGEESFVLSHAKRASRNSIFANGLVLVVVAIVVVCARSYYYFFFFGPLPLNDNDILALTKLPDSGGLLTYADLGPRVPIETHWKEVTTKDDKPQYESEYYFVAVQNEVLLVLAKSRKEAARPIGPISRMRKFDEQIVERVLKEQPQYQGRILPFVLYDAAAFTVIGYIGLALMVPVVLFSGINIVRATWSLSVPMQHSFVRKLSRYGDSGAIVSSVDKSVAAGEAEQVGRGLLVGFWLIRPTLFGMQLFPLAEVVWIYKLALSGESSLMLHFRDGKKAGIRLASADVDEMIERISKRCPWVRSGYSRKWLNEWRTNRAAFVAKVDPAEDIEAAG